MRSPWIAILVLMLCSTAGWAADQAHYNRVTLSAEAQVEVKQDLLVAVLYAQREGKRVDRLANEVNQLIQRAIDRVKKVQNIKVRTLSYQTYPIHDKKRAAHWRVQQRIRLESRDSQLLGTVLGQLQADLQLQSLDYQVSANQQRQHQAKLTQDALQNFQQRAFEVTQALGMHRYKLVRVNINGGGQGMISRPMHRERMMRVQDAAAPVALEAGTQQLRVSVNGEIELFDR